MCKKMFLILATLLGMPVAHSATGVLGTPADGSTVSGVGVISGYHCTSKNIEVFIDGVSIGPAGAGTRLLGTQGVCGRTDTGYALLYAFNNLSDGHHVISVTADGVEFDSNTVTTVKSGGTGWLTGANKTVSVPDFPKSGQTTVLTWTESYQNFLVTRVDQGQSSPSVLSKTELLKGRWRFDYTILSAFTSTYTLDRITGTTNSQGGYYIYGTDQYGDAVNAAYWPNDGNWALLDPGPIIDKFYTFTTDGINVLGGCYYQVTTSSGTWSRCYPLSGSKIAALNAQVLGTLDKPRSLKDALLDSSASEVMEYAPIDEATAAKYMQLKR